MACGSCSTKKDKNGVPLGCKSNGNCSSDGCNKLTVFDWLSNMKLPQNTKPFLGVEVRFKNSRKAFVKNITELPIRIGDSIVVQIDSGYDIGIVTLTGELVKVQMKRKKVKLEHATVHKILRKATEKDVNLWQQLQDKETDIQIKAREIALRLGLSMKISDVEFQADGTKIVFYYTAEERIDFRQLIKDLAYQFKTRIEMKQIGLRQEASRIGGIGSCGRELCCSTWLTDFRAVNTSAARYQQLSINPQKLVGQCGKLKCCLNFELNTYLDILKDFPKSDIKLKTQKGVAICQKVDIFGGYLWYTYEGDWVNWHKISKEKAKEIIALNQKDKRVESLELYIDNVSNKQDTSLNFENAIDQDSITRFDHKSKKSRNYKSSSKNRSNRSRPNTSDKSQSKERSSRQKATRFNDRKHQSSDVNHTTKNTSSRSNKKKHITNKGNSSTTGTNNSINKSTKNNRVRKTNNSSVQNKSTSHKKHDKTT